MLGFDAISTLPISTLPGAAPPPPEGQPFYILDTYSLPDTTSLQQA